MNEPKFCRFCAASKPSTELLDLRCNEENLENIIRILRFLDINFVILSDDALPKSICAFCYQNLKSCYNVFRRIKDSQKVLTDLFSKEDNSERKLEQSEIVRKRDDDTTTSEDEPKLDQEIDEPYEHVPALALPPPAPKKPATWSTYPNKCYQCGINWRSIIDLRDHSRSAHGEFHGFRCFDCEIMVPTFHTFVEHVREHRPELIGYCPICDLKTDDPNHVNSHPESFEDQALFVSPSPTVAAESKRPVRDLSRFFGPRVPSRVEIKSWKQYPWVCQVCNMQCQDQTALRNHLKKVHKKCFGFKCADCITVSQNFEMFINHVRIHQPSLALRCEHCDFELSGRREYIVHIQEHILDFECATCGDYFHDREGSRKHRLQYNASDAKPERPYKCNQCSRRFRLKYHLQNHNYLHSDKTPNTCQQCNKSFKTKNALKSHERSHSKTYYNPRTSFANRSDYTSQIVTQTAGDPASTLMQPQTVTQTAGNPASTLTQPQTVSQTAGNPASTLTQPQTVSQTAGNPASTLTQPQTVTHYEAPPINPTPAQTQPQVGLHYDRLLDYADFFLANGKRVPIDEDSTKVADKTGSDK